MQYNVKTVTRLECYRGDRGWYYRAWYNGEDYGHKTHLIPDTTEATEPAAACLMAVRDIVRYRELHLAADPTLGTRLGPGLRLGR